MKFVFNTRVGFDIPLNDLDDRFDAVFISIGTWKESWVYQPGTELKGVYPALLFLESAPQARRRALGRKVAVIGGGNAAIDSARTALRKGAEVLCFIAASGKTCLPSKKKPRPHEDEGAKIVFLAAPHRVIGDAAGQGKVDRNREDPPGRIRRVRAAENRSRPMRSSASSVIR